MVDVVLFISDKLHIYRGVAGKGLHSTNGVRDRDSRRESEPAYPVSLWSSECQCLLKRYDWTAQGSLPLGCKIVQKNLDLIILGIAGFGSLSTISKQ